MAKAASTTEHKKLVTAHARQLHIAPRKMRLVTNMVKNMQVNDALAQLAHSGKKAAPMVAKLLQSAIANATNNFSLDADHLYIKNITADQGQVLKRYFPRARGSAFVIRRKLSHVNVVLEERKQAKAGKSTRTFLRKTEKPVEQSVDAKEAVSTKPAKELGRKSEVPKTEQQVKENKSQNKRRLFNRRAGE